jgi:hypothetical protein
MTSAALHDGRSRQTRADLGGNEKGDGRFGDQKKKEEMDEQLVIMISGRKQTNADLMKSYRRPMRVEDADRDGRRGVGRLNMNGRLSRFQVVPSCLGRGSRDPPPRDGRLGLSRDGPSQEPKRTSPSLASSTVPASLAFPIWQCFSKSKLQPRDCLRAFTSVAKWKTPSQRLPISGDMIVTDSPTQTGSHFQISIC